MRARKWWRLGEVLSGVRRRPWTVLSAPVAAARIVFSRTTLPTAPGRAAPSGQEPAPAFSSADFPRQERLEVSPARDLLVATFLDEPSARAFEHEWRSVELTEGHWRQLMADQPFHLLLVESTRSWEQPSPAAKEMVGAFQERGVPTAFWNTRDPLRYDRYLDAARLFDVVFTVAEECLPRYREDLGHDRVHHLPFGVQPKVHHPVSAGPRERSLAFIGSYAADLAGEAVVSTLLQPAGELGLEIFDGPDPDEGDQPWPAPLSQHHLGRLDHDQLSLAYKSYKGLVHIDGANGSSSVCSPRVLEAAAANTPVISTRAPAIDRFLGPGAVQVDTAEEARASLRFLLGSEEYRARIARLALRAVMRRHTTSHRVDTVLEKVGLDPASRLDAFPLVTVVAPSNRPELVENTLASAAAQTYPRIEFLLLAHGYQPDEPRLRDHAASLGLNHVSFLTVDAGIPLGGVLNRGLASASGDYVWKMDDDDFYAPEFLHDLIDAFSYTDAEMVGKSAHFAYLQSLDMTIFRGPSLEHSYVEQVHGATMVVARSLVDQVRFPEIPQGSDTRFQQSARSQGARIYGADRFNFVYVRAADASGHTWQAPDTRLLTNSVFAYAGHAPEQVTV